MLGVAVSAVYAGVTCSCVIVTCRSGARTPPGRTRRYSCRSPLSCRLHICELISGIGQPNKQLFSWSAFGRVCPLSRSAASRKLYTLQAPGRRLVPTSSSGAVRHFNALPRCIRSSFGCVSTVIEMLKTLCGEGTRVNVAPSEYRRPSSPAITSIKNDGVVMMEVSACVPAVWKT